MAIKEREENWDMAINNFSVHTESIQQVENKQRRHYKELVEIYNILWQC